jgi:prephenate dehydratase/chorismate mutase
MMKPELEELRRKIDRIDEGIVRLLAQRMEVAVRLKRLKRSVQDPKREEEVLQKVRGLSRPILSPLFAERLYREILGESRSLQEREIKLVGFQGEHGAYSEAAARTYDASLVAIPCADFAGVFDGVESGLLDFGIVPVENSLEGAVTQVTDLLIERNLKIIGSVALPVHHALLTLPETDERDLKLVLSHPQALGQCARYREEHGLEARPFYDTAGAAKMLSEERPASTGVIAGRFCADLYGLKVVAENIEDHPSNRTRFVVLAADRATEHGDRCTVVFTVDNETGALFHILKIFADAGINLTRIESRPVRGDGTRYGFLMDFDASGGEGNVAECLKKLEESVATFKFLGSYREATE